MRLRILPDASDSFIVDGPADVKFMSMLFMTGSKVTCTVVAMVKNGFVIHQLLMRALLRLDMPNNGCLFNLINRKKELFT